MSFRYKFLFTISICTFLTAHADSPTCDKNKREQTFNQSQLLVSSIREKSDFHDVDFEVQELEQLTLSCNIPLIELKINAKTLQQLKLKGYEAEERKALRNLNSCYRYADISDEFSTYEKWARKLGRSSFRIERTKADLLYKNSLFLLKKSQETVDEKSSKICINEIESNHRTHKSFIKTKANTSSAISVVSEEHLQSLFKQLAGNPYIPFKYPEDGCYARAHEMVKLLEEQCVYAGKIFIEGNLRVETTNSPKGYVEWWYHVAPIVRVEKDGKQVPYVIDPSLFNKAVPLDDWIEIQTGHNYNQKKTTYMTKRFNYTPSDTIADKNEFIDKDVLDSQKTLKKYLKIQTERQLPGSI